MRDRHKERSIEYIRNTGVAQRLPLTYWREEELEREGAAAPASLLPLLFLLLLDAEAAADRSPLMLRTFLLLLPLAGGGSCALVVLCGLASNARLDVRGALFCLVTAAAAALLLLLVADTSICVSFSSSSVWVAQEPASPWPPLCRRERLRLDVVSAASAVTASDARTGDAAGDAAG